MTWWRIHLVWPWLHGSDWFTPTNFFWYRPETNLRAWNEEFPEIKHGSQAKFWSEKSPRAYWKGNPDVASPLRVELVKCNDSNRWGAEIMRQVELELHLLHELVAHILDIHQISCCWCLPYIVHFRIGRKKQKMDLRSPNYQISVIIGKYSFAMSCSNWMPS